MSSSILKSKAALGRAIGRFGINRATLEIERLRRAFWKQPPGALVRYLNYNIRITDGPNFYIQCKDEFVHQIYHFDAQRPDAFIIDGGSNMGMSILYFKRLYPQSRITGFEPDPNIFGLLKENVSNNGLEGVTLIDAGLGGEEGTVSFDADNKAAGQFSSDNTGIRVRVERLSPYISEPVDFLKLNIEGQELPVLEELEASDKIGLVKELVLEYHGWANGEQRLGRILNLLDRCGFRYLVHDFDHETGYATKPPFRHTNETVWFCLVHAKRMD
jgi:FkbM family methyltransferase